MSATSCDTTANPCSASQFGFPRGFLGHLAGWAMAIEHTRSNRFVVDQLDVGPEDRVLEVGCGPGGALVVAQSRAQRGFVAGIDPSSVMVAQSRRRLRRAIAAGLAEVRVAGAEAIPYPDSTFTRAFSIYSVDHWNSIPSGIAELARVLAPGARLGLALRREAGNGAPSGHHHGAGADDIANLERLLVESGFTQVGVSHHVLGGETLTIVSAVR